MKKILIILPLASILCFMVGCQDKEAMAELEAMKAQAEVEEQNKALVLRWFEEGMNKQNPDIIDEFFDANHILHFPGQPEDVNLDGWKQLVSAFIASFPDIHFTIEDQIAEGDKVVTRWTLRCTHQGEYMGIPATGKQVTYTGINISRHINGKYVEDWGNWDELGLMQQLGMELKPKEGEK
jgi:predicted ester cyclase